jgi:hypothetical protein
VLVSDRGRGTGRWGKLRSDSGHGSVGHARAIFRRFQTSEDRSGILPRGPVAGGGTRKTDIRTIPDS